MDKFFGALFLLLALAACSGMPQSPHTASACAGSESSYECQVERYHNVNVQ
jgi:hypothetical protein